MRASQVCCSIWKLAPSGRGTLHDGGTSGGGGAAGVAETSGSPASIILSNSNSITGGGVVDAGGVVGVEGSGRGGSSDRTKSWHD